MSRTQNNEYKPPNLSAIPTLKIPLPEIDGLTSKPITDPVEQAELLRFKLQRALQQKDLKAVRTIEQELADLIEREDLAFGTTPEEDENADTA